MICTLQGKPRGIDIAAALANDASLLKVIVFSNICHNRPKNANQFVCQSYKDSPMKRDEVTFDYAALLSCLGLSRHEPRVQAPLQYAADEKQVCFFF